MPDVTKLNDAIKDWTKKARKDLKAEEKKLKIKHSAGSNWQRTGYRHRSGVISRISFKMPRHAIFVHKGVGRGTPISKVGQTNRRAKPWFNPVMDESIPDLADAVAEEQADLMINGIDIK